MASLRRNIFTSHTSHRWYGAVNTKSPSTIGHFVDARNRYCWNGEGWRVCKMYGAFPQTGTCPWGWVLDWVLGVVEAVCAALGWYLVAEGVRATPNGTQEVSHPKPNCQPYRLCLILVKKIHVASRRRWIAATCRNYLFFFSLQHKRLWKSGSFLCYLLFAKAFFFAIQSLKNRIYVSSELTIQKPALSYLLSLLLWNTPQKVEEWCEWVSESKWKRQNTTPKNDWCRL